MTDRENKLSPCMYNRTLEERKRGCRFCSAACKGRIKESEMVDTNAWLKEEPVSDPENLEKEVDRLCELYHFTATLGEIRFIARHFAK